MFTGIQGIPSAIPNRLAYANFDPKVLGLFYDLSGFNQSLVRDANGLPQIPQVKIDETIASGYLQGNFEQDVLGMRLTGNAGVRYTFTKDVGTGTNIRRQTRLNAAGREPSRSVRSSWRSPTPISMFFRRSTWRLQSRPILSCKATGPRIWRARGRPISSRTSTASMT